MSATRRRPVSIAPSVALMSATFWSGNRRLAASTAMISMFNSPRRTSFISSRMSPSWKISVLDGVMLLGARPPTSMKCTKRPAIRDDPAVVEISMDGLQVRQVGRETVRTMRSLVMMTSPSSEWPDGGNDDDRRADQSRRCWWSAEKRRCGQRDRPGPHQNPPLP